MKKANKMSESDIAKLIENIPADALPFLSAISHWLKGLVNEHGMTGKVSLSAVIFTLFRDLEEFGPLGFNVDSEIVFPEVLEYAKGLYGESEELNKLVRKYDIKSLRQAMKIKINRAFNCGNCRSNNLNKATGHGICMMQLKKYSRGETISCPGIEVIHDALTAWAAQEPFPGWWRLVQDEGFGYYLEEVKNSETGKTTWVRHDDERFHEKNRERREEINRLNSLKADSYVNGRELDRLHFHR